MENLTNEERNLINFISKDGKPYQISVEYRKAWGKAWLTQHRETLNSLIKKGLFTDEGSNGKTRTFRYLPPVDAAPPAPTGTPAYALSVTYHFWNSRIEGYADMDGKQKTAAQETLAAEICQKLVTG